MPAGGRPTVRSRRLGAVLRRYRQAAKLDQPQAAEVIASSQARISRLETGHVTARVIEVRLLLDAYGVKDPEVRMKLEELARQPKKRGWWLEYAPHLRSDYVDHIALEDDACHIRQWQPVLIPGLLQTPAYAEAVITGGPDTLATEQVARLVKVRMRRQEKIAEGGARFAAVLWEAVIEHPLASMDIHREQLASLLDVGKRENVTVQVLPFSAGALVAAASAFAAFSFDAGAAIEAVTMDDLMSSSVLESPDDLEVYARLFDLLHSAALTPEVSAKLIQSKLRSIEAGV
ncbi:helix-turn-helix transcriptional regulator [Streptomyces sp. DH24]|uniref:helix-turn-helix domain-containing protein n=1 Tax=Streptomyces sp. DH24 TaxID=3040123 RepID=UPI0024434AF0|nr:helix-turn-helix transcriptional regulator [Streptomyces sp. DH24]MDG9719269.1 helix-turn-helix transcriptional regulator [Streptomyces sp. DH24]